MKKHFAATSLSIFVAIVAMVLCGAVSAQTDQTSTTQTTTTTTTTTNPSTTNTATTDTATETAENTHATRIHLTPSVIRAAQQKLNDAGYQSGTPDGKLGPQTRSAIRKYQQDQGMKANGTLDERTLSKLNVGGNQTMATAPGDLKSGAKAAGHDIKGKHPVAAAKDMGKGIGEAGKAVGEGTKSDVVSAKDKTKSKISRKKTEHEEHEKAEDTGQAPPK